jgi:hypothetical protein
MLKRGIRCNIFDPAGLFGQQHRDTRQSTR